MSYLPVVTYRTCTRADQSAVEAFFNSIRAELYLPDPAAVRAMCDRFFDNGGAIAGDAGGEIVAVMGYFRGDPADNFADKSVGFVYVAGLAPKHRGTTAFRRGLRFTAETFQAMGIREIRLHALATDARLNAMYGSFMQTSEPQINLRGFACNLYRSSVDHVLAVLARRQRHNPRRYDPAPAGRPLIRGMAGV